MVMIHNSFDNVCNIIIFESNECKGEKKDDEFRIST